MDKALIDLVVDELKNVLTGTRFRSITQVGKYQFVITFEDESFYRLLISCEPRDPRIYLIRRRDRDLKKSAVHRSLFAIAVDKALGGMSLASLEIAGNERIVEMTFCGTGSVFLIVQLTGSSSNVFLLDTFRLIVAAARPSTVDGQIAGSAYSFISSQAPSNSVREPPLIGTIEGSVSEALDTYYSAIDEKAEFQKLVESKRAKLRQQIAKANKLIRNLKNDLAEHGDADKWKRIGDLLLASQNTATRSPGEIEVIDIFDEARSSVRIEADDRDSIPQTAQKYFRRFTKARNAENEINERIRKTQITIERLRSTANEIEQAGDRHDIEYFSKVASEKGRTAAPKSKTKGERQLSGIRAYISSDGFEILVGKKSTDNDVLTQRIAHSRDTWLHAADYPGSHVVIRNANRKSIPHRTLIEAAKLAAFFSKGNKQPKAAVNYTEKKFVSKPKRSAPGLVRLASFKTLFVEPEFPQISKKDL